GSRTCDVANLAWKTKLVLPAVAKTTLLDTYSIERSEHAKHAIGMSVELGQIICKVNPEKVPARGSHFLASGPNPEETLSPMRPKRVGIGAIIIPEGVEETLAVISINGQLSYRTDP